MFALILFFQEKEGEGSSTMKKCNLPLFQRFGMWWMGTSCKCRTKEGFCTLHIAHCGYEGEAKP